jgi:enterochelin esterase family protein
VVAAFVQPGERLVEYADDPRHATYLTKELVPRMEAEFGALAEPRARCLVGASFGAVAALSAAVAEPGYFGRLLLQSGSFAGAGKGCRPRPEPLWQPVKRFVAGFLARPAAVADRVFLSCGAYESLICENRGLAPVLAATGMAVNFVESLGGHNWACWRDTIGAGLPWLFGED